MPLLSLEQLLSRIGERKLAARIGITQRTLKTWLRRGPSAKGAARIELVLKRASASLKAAQTRRRYQEFQEGLSTPPSSELSPKQVLPKRPPREAKEATRIQKSRGVVAGREVYETDRYLGERQWLTIGQPVLEVSLQTLTDSVVHNWEMSGRNWNFVNFLFFRYIPFNPTYRGELVGLQGKWVEWWTRTPTRGTPSSIENAIKSVFVGYKKRDTRGTIVDIQGAFEAAQTRMIWLETIQVVNFDDKDNRR